MDTATHIVMGVALGGLATLDPAVQSDPALFNAVLVGTIVGSQAPDSDTVLKLKNNAVYIRHHRGITHSIPAVVLWGISIPAVIHAFVPEVSFLHLWLWSFLAVILHVFVDVFNAYGTQAYRPFTKRWVAYGFINTFDPYIFLMHIAGIIAWNLGASPGPMWLIIYFVIALYYVKRYMDKRTIVKRIHAHFGDVEQIATSPTMKQNIWRIAITTPDKYYVGRAVDGEITILDEFRNKPIDYEDPVVKKALTDHNIKAFLSFSPVYRYEMNYYDEYTEVRFIDLRYRSRGRYPFVALAQIDDEHGDKLKILNSYTGWVFTEEKLQNKLSPMEDSR
ncbi:metal-dependent hydrolase [Halobacillus sp. ACCC02827]|uniref:metal-dependent hydrolase n=1 Tax=Bacillaceae TaxID=186817 RepID=UPI0002A4D07F|nr:MULTISPECIES: metal-dependent hydrolase [Bacillaceae]ELK48814.1 membrane-bound metal-dependent hydrolase [Halobacillus sp. BAB-2008]QHT45856.1 metal-dependent hydrolase [Bacillus sp. SB49]WJE16660.1 metal-dependent hydrolase [Halobacillus sp. ACCC02827]